MQYKSNAREPILRMYPGAALRGARIVRDGRTIQHDLELDAELVELLGCDHVGIFVESSGKLIRLRRKLEHLNASDGIGQWFVIMSTSTEHLAMYNAWRDLKGRGRVSPRKLPPVWRSRKLVFTTPEGLDEAASETIERGVPVAGFILFDPTGTVHEERGNRWNSHDRPQLIVDCRARLSIAEWSPPFVVLVDRLARSINTQPMQTAYSLNAWRYLDGHTLTFKTSG